MKKGKLFKSLIILVLLLGISYGMNSKVYAANENGDNKVETIKHVNQKVIVERGNKKRS